MFCHSNLSMLIFFISRYDQFPEKHKETIDEVYLNELELVKGVDTRYKFIIIIF